VTVTVTGLQFASGVTPAYAGRRNTDTSVLESSKRNSCSSTWKQNAEFPSSGLPLNMTPQRARGWQLIYAYAAGSNRQSTFHPISPSNFTNGGSEATHRKLELQPQPLQAQADNHIVQTLLSASMHPDIGRSLL
jgi:hypothetical protein